MPKTADYQTYCPIARALDVLGDRWTLLIMRELTLGERRFTDLRDRLPGIPPNLLSQRLKDLTGEGLVTTRELPPPAARTVYAATESGRATIPILRSLARFGVHRLGPADDTTDFRPDSTVASTLTAFYDRDRAGDLDELYEVIVDGEPFVLASKRGGSTRPATDRPDLTVTVSADTLFELRRGVLTVAQATAEGKLHRRGPAAALRNFRRIFQLA